MAIEKESCQIAGNTLSWRVPSDVIFILTNWRLEIKER